MSGTFGPWTSASSRPTRWPSWVKPSAIDGNRRLADPAFAAGDGEEPVRAAEWPRFGHRFVWVWMRLARFVRQRHGGRPHPVADAASEL